MDTFKNNNDRQKYFNQVRGFITEINDHEKYPSITIKAGHENQRDINVSVKKIMFNETVVPKFSIGDKVSIRFFITSNKHNGRWFTSANMLDIFKDTYTEN